VKLVSTPQVSDSRTELNVGEYEALASHYYDATFHPTCAALRAASKSMVVEFLASGPTPGAIVELGAGKALTPECLSEWQFSGARLVLTDSSPTMLAYSEKYRSDSVELRVCPAHSTGLPSGMADLVISSLGDPYNDSRLWFEVHRLLAPGGIAIFTTPSWEWSTAFRPKGQQSAQNTSEFASPDGKMVAVPSFILERKDQEKLFRQARLQSIGFSVRCVRDVSQALRAPKLGVVSPDTPFMAGYLIKSY
jgi:SAM-dependent methyltransferase